MVIKRGCKSPLYIKNEVIKMNKILMSIIAVSAIFSNTSTIYANDIAVNNKIEEKEVTEDEYLQNINISILSLKKKRHLYYILEEKLARIVENFLQY